MKRATLIRRTFRIARRKPREIGVVFVSDKKMRRLNKAYRGIDATTDVLSFKPADILISTREARRRKHSLELLIVHGTLHLLGYDHERTRDAERMEKLEKKILKM